MYIRKTIALALLALTCRTEAYAAPKKVSSADEAKAVTSITKDLLNKQKNAALSYRKVYQDILADPARYEAIRTTLQSDLEAAQAAKETRSSELLQALQEKTEVELLQLIVPHIVPFNEGLLALVTIYKGQACAPGGNPAACIGSTWNRRRIAMGAIIDSQAADLKALEAFATSSSQIIYSLITQLQLIGSDAPSDLLDFGLPHYQNNLNVTLQTLVDTTADIAPFFDGKDLDGQPSPRELPCLIGMSVPLNNFKDELLAIKSAASGFSGNHDGFLEYLQGASEIYDGSSHGPGVIDHWHGCIDSKQLQINTLQVSLSQARAAGDMNSAANFESTINTLQQDIAKLDAESKILELRRDQITAILNSQATLFDGENLSDLSWVNGVSAHVDDLISGMVIYPNMLRAMRALANSALAQLSILNGGGTTQAIKDKALQLAARFETIIGSSGYGRVLVDTSFPADTVFPNLAQAIRIGESALTANIQTFEQILQQTAAFSLAEQLGLAARLIQATQDVNTAQSNFNAAAAFVAELQAALQNHDVYLQEISAKAATLETVLGVARFNPIYTDMANSFTNSLRSDKRFKAAGAKIQSGVRSYLKKFKATTPATGYGLTCFNKKGTCASPLVRKASTQRTVLVNDMAAQLDTLGRPYLGGQNISQLINEILARQAALLSHEH